MTAQDEFCKNSNGGLFPHEKYCDFYYRCDRNQNRAILEMCPNGMVFAGHRRGSLNNCDYPFRVGCPNEDRVMGRKKSTHCYLVVILFQLIGSISETPYNQNDCPWKYGVFAHESSCTRYLDCWNGTVTVQQCPFSLLYNEKIHSCDWADNVPDCQKHRKQA